MLQSQNQKIYDLEERTYQFAINCRNFTRKVPRTLENIEDASQLIRSSGSVAGNYIEANESISSKDFIHRIKICRKEAKESRLWLKLTFVGANQPLQNEQKYLINEALELTRIFGSIIEKRK